MKRKNTVFMKLLSLALGMALAASALPQAHAKDVSAFKDVTPADWFYDAVVYSCEHAIDTGLRTNAFAPNETMTREWFIMDLGKVHGINDQSFDCGRFDRYQDVDSFSLFAPYIMWGTVHGVIAGVGEERFDPQGSLTREQLATIIARYLEIFFPEAVESLKQSVANDIVFVDADQISDWAQDSVELLRQIGLLHGDHMRRANPQGVLTRAEAVTVLMNLREAILPWLEQRPAIAKIEIKASNVYLDSPTTEVAVIAYDAEGNEIPNSERWCHLMVSPAKNDPVQVSYDASTGIISVLNYDELDTTDAEPFTDELWEYSRLQKPYKATIMGFADIVPLSVSTTLKIYGYNIDIRDTTEWTDEYRRSFSREFIKIVNEERVSKGLSPIILDDQLLQAATIRAEEHVGGITLSHTRPDGQSARTVLQDIDYDTLDPRRCGFGECAASQMLFMGMTDDMHVTPPAHYANQFFEMYKKSPEHYEILMWDMDNMRGASAMSVNSSRRFNIFICVC